MASSTASLSTTLRRRLRRAQFVRGQAQDGAVDHRHAFHAPVLGVRGDECVEFRRAGHGAFEELIGEFARGFLGAGDSPEAVFDAAGILLANLPLEQHLQRVLPGLLTQGHV